MHFVGAFSGSKDTKHEVLHSLIEWLTLDMSVVSLNAHLYTCILVHCPVYTRYVSVYAAAAAAMKAECTLHFAYGRWV